jgi:hypothetical protein
MATAPPLLLVPYLLIFFTSCLSIPLVSPLPKGRRKESRCPGDLLPAHGPRFCSPPSALRIVSICVLHACLSIPLMLSVLQVARPPSSKAVAAAVPRSHPWCVFFFFWEVGGGAHHCECAGVLHLPATVRMNTHKYLLSQAAAVLLKGCRVLCGPLEHRLSCLPSELCMCFVLDERALLTLCCSPQGRPRAAAQRAGPAMGCASAIPELAGRVPRTR